MSEDKSLPQEEEERLDNQAESSEGADDTPQASAEPDSGTEDETESAEGDTESEVEQLLRRIEELEAENTELKNQYLRKQADFENFRKRMMREKEESAQFNNQQLLLDLVSVIDDFERAIKSADDSRDYDAFHDGVVIIEKQLTGMLQRKWKLSRFDSAGETFDPQRHEAVATEERDDVPESTVLDEYQKGYTLNERVIRSAKVKVSTKKEEQEEGET